METSIARNERRIEDLQAELKSVTSMNRRWIVQEKIDFVKLILDELKEDSRLCSCKKAAPVSLNAREEFFKEDK